MSRRRRSRRDREALVASYERSGVSLYAFARDNYVAYSTLARWTRELGTKTKRTPTASAPRLLPVRVTASPPPTANSPSTCQVRLRSGHELRVPAGFDPATLTALLTALDAGSCSR